MVGALRSWSWFPIYPLLQALLHHKFIQFHLSSQGWYRVPTSQTLQIHPPRLLVIFLCHLPEGLVKVGFQSVLHHLHLNTPASESAKCSNHSFQVLKNAISALRAESKCSNTFFGSYLTNFTIGPTPILRMVLHHRQAGRPMTEATRERINNLFHNQPQPLNHIAFQALLSQPMYAAGVSQPFISHMSRSLFRHASGVPSRQPYPASSYSRPTAYNSIDQTTNPHTSWKASAFVASDPFWATHWKEKVNAPSDGLTFDNIPTAGSLPVMRGQKSELIVVDMSVSW